MSQRSLMVQRKNRLCIDPQDLNKNIRREHYYSKTIDEILPLLHGATKISAGDTNKGYWHIELDYESSLFMYIQHTIWEVQTQEIAFWSESFTRYFLAQIR